MLGFELLSGRLHWIIAAFNGLGCRPDCVVTTVECLSESFTVLDILLDGQNNHCL